MVSFTIASFIGLAAIATAQTTSLPGATGAKAQSCDSAYTLCVSSYTSVDTCKAQQTACEASCAAKRATCGDAYNANQALCTAAETSCLGHLADAQAGNGGSAAAPTTTVLALQTVTAFVTTCPYATSFTQNGQVYVASVPNQVITVTNCPCTISAGSLVSTPTGGSGNGGSGNGGSGTAATTGAVVTPNSSRSNTTATYTPVKYTGGASIMGAGLGAVAGAAGLLAFAL